MIEPAVILLDTSTISHLMRDPMGSPAQHYRRRMAQRMPCQLVTSVVVDAELRFGLRRNPSPRLQASYELFMASITVEPLAESVAEHYAQLRHTLERKGRPIGPNDTLIAAHALALQATLVSADADFKRVPGLQVENWLR